MDCPFPGMDPYIERPAIWADFHDSLITEIRRELQPMLRPKYAALVQDRLYVVQSKRPIKPDVSIVQGPAQGSGNAATATLPDLDQPLVFELWREEIREPFLQIIEPAAGNRLVTAIEVLSPDNKKPGPGRRRYLKKRLELRRSRTNLVEIDLLRAGKPTLSITAEELATLPSWHYVAAVTRWPSRQEIYPIDLRSRLPKIAIPLGEGDEDVRLDLQSAFARTWDAGPYPTLSVYAQPPPGELTADELAWCAERLRAAGTLPA